MGKSSLIDVDDSVSHIEHECALWNVFGLGVLPKLLKRMWILTILLPHSSFRLLFMTASILLERLVPHQTTMAIL